jgi:hypothetical protein
VFACEVCLLERDLWEETLKCYLTTQTLYADVARATTCRYLQVLVGLKMFRRWLQHVSVLSLYVSMDGRTDG